MSDTVLKITNAIELKSIVPESINIPELGDVSFDSQQKLLNGRGIFPGNDELLYIIGAASGAISSITLSIIANFIYDKITKRKGKLKKLNETEYVIILPKGGKIEIYISE